MRGAADKERIFSSRSEQVWLAVGYHNDTATVLVWEGCTNALLSGKASGIRMIADRPKEALP